MDGRTATQPEEQSEPFATADAHQKQVLLISSETAHLYDSSKHFSVNPSRLPSGFSSALVSDSHSALVSLSLSVVLPFLCLPQEPLLLPPFSATLLCRFHNAASFARLSCAPDAAKNDKHGHQRMRGQSRHQRPMERSALTWLLCFCFARHGQIQNAQLMPSETGRNVAASLRRSPQRNEADAQRIVHRKRFEILNRSDKESQTDPKSKRGLARTWRCGRNTKRSPKGRLPGKMSWSLARKAARNVSRIPSRPPPRMGGSEQGS